MEEIFIEERLLHLAIDFYFYLMYEAEYEDDYSIRLMTFMECVLQILYCMSELVINGTVDMGVAYEYDGSCYKLHEGNGDGYVCARSKRKKRSIFTSWYK